MLRGLAIYGAGEVGGDSLRRLWLNFLVGGGLQLPTMLGVHHPIPHKAQLLALVRMWQNAHHCDNALGVHACTPLALAIDYAVPVLVIWSSIGSALLQGSIKHLHIRISPWLARGYLALFKLGSNHHEGLHCSLQY